MSPEHPGASEPPSELHQVARGSVLNVFAMILGTTLGFVLTVVVGRWLQPETAGAFFELVAIFSILSYTVMLGADTGLTRWISRARAIGGISKVRRILVVALGPVLLAGILAATVMWVAAPEIAHTFLRGMTTSDAIEDVRIVAPMVPLAAMSACLLAALRAYGLMWPYLAIEGLGKPIARLLFVLAALFLGLRLGGVVAGWSLPVAMGLVAAWLILLRIITANSVGARHRPPSLRSPGSRGGIKRRRSSSHVPHGGDLGRHRGSSVHGASDRRLAAEFWRFAGPRGFAGTFQIVIVWLDILLVGALLSRYAAGVYGAVSKIAMVGNFALEGMRLAIGPQLSQLLARHEYGKTTELYQSATRWLMMAAWPIYLLFAIFPTVVLGIFGHSYASGAASLVVLSLAMLVSLGTGNVSVVLLMAGKSSWNVVNTLVALAINIGLNFLLLPHIGILGAAIAWAASIVFDNLAAVIEVRLLLGLGPFGPGYVSVIAATCGCFGIVGLAARELLGQSPIGLITATGAGLAAFIVVSYVHRERLGVADLAALLPKRLAPATRHIDQRAA